MKNIYLVGGLLFFTISALSAQEIASFVWKKQKGIAISKKDMPLLMNRTWTTYRQYEIIEDTASIRMGSFIAFQFTNEGQLYGTAGKISLNGTWILKNKKTLQINLADSTALVNNGDYSIYKLNESELVLVQISNKGAPRLILYCKGNKANIFAEPYDPTTKPVKTDLKELEVAREKSERTALINEIETEMILRKLKPKQNLTTLDIKILQILKKQILTGTYHLKTIKS